jgi:hypothetical protein
VRCRTKVRQLFPPSSKGAKDQDGGDHDDRDATGNQPEPLSSLISFGPCRRLGPM